MTTRFQGAYLQEQGIRFAVVIAQPHIVNDLNKDEASRMIAVFERQVFHAPVILMAQDARGMRTYYGMQDIAKFLSSIPLQNIPWQEFTYTEL